MAFLAVAATLAANLLVLIAPAARAESEGLYLFETYRPDADPAADLELAKARAQAEDKRILIEVGGDWCIWCHILDRYLLAEPDVMAAYEDAFVVMKVNWAQDDDRNEAFLAQYPERAGYPHFFILDADGTFLASKNTVELEDGGESYDRDAMLAFAQSWDLPGL
jgi:thiol:disulfide interchange protein